MDKIMNENIILIDKILEIEHRMPLLAETARSQADGSSTRSVTGREIDPAHTLTWYLPGLTRGLFRPDTASSPGTRFRFQVNVFMPSPAFNVDCVTTAPVSSDILIPTRRPSRR